MCDCILDFDSPPAGAITYPATVQYGYGGTATRLSALHSVATLDGVTYFYA